jgi:hypothetical protein
MTSAKRGEAHTLVERFGVCADASETRNDTASVEARNVFLIEHLRRNCGCMVGCKRFTAIAAEEQERAHNLLTD